MLATTTRAAALPGPPELLPGRPDAIIDLQTDDGARLAGAQWRYCRRAGRGDRLRRRRGRRGPRPARAGHGAQPHLRRAPARAGRRLRRLGLGRARARGHDAPARRRPRVLQLVPDAVTIPEQVGDLDPTGATVVFEVVVDDYAEVWVNGELPLALGQTDGRVASAASTRPTASCSRATPGPARRSRSPSSASTARSRPRRATTSGCARRRSTSTRPIAREAAWAASTLEASRASLDATLERVAGGFEFTEGPVWAPEGALLFSSPNTNVIYRWHPEGRVEVFRTKSGYTRHRHRPLPPARLQRPGVRPAGPADDLPARQPPRHPRRTARQHHRARRRAARLNSPNDLVYRSDGVAVLHRPAVRAARRLRRPDKSSVQRRLPRRATARSRSSTDELEGPNGHRVLARRALPLRRQLGRRPQGRDALRGRADGALAPGELFFDMTDAPGEDAIDGIKVDPDGNLYVCGPGGIWVLSPERRAPRHARACPRSAQPRVGRRRRPHPLHHRADQRLPDVPQHPRIRPDAERPDKPAATSSPISSSPTRTATMHRLSELQGDDLWCSARARRALPARAPAPALMVPLPRVVLGRVHELVTILPGDLHDTFKMKIATGATGRSWPTPTSSCRRSSTSASTRTRTTRRRAAHARARARPRDRQGLRRLLVLGPPLAVPAVAGPPGPAAGSSPTPTRRRAAARAAYAAQAA